jgi:PPK2 family polyphosphate:nucleotide phosphotransferase
MAKRFDLGKVRMLEAVGDRRSYEDRLKHLQLAMLRIQQAYFRQGRRGIVVLEGMDASGKGGAIRRMTETLDPRGVKVWPIGAPTAEEQGRHYLWRFWQRLPERGTIAIFDRSWYGRVLVERVEGLAPKSAWKRAYGEIVDFERMLTDDGVRLVKVFLHISNDEQLRRFAERLSNPYKRWKLTEADLRTRDLWKQYQEAIEEAVARTGRTWAPWRVIGANRKWSARLGVLEAVTEALARDVSLEPPAFDLKEKRAACRRLGLDPKVVLGSSG